MGYVPGVLGFHERAIDEVVSPVSLRPVGTEGGVIVFETVTVMMLEYPVFPALSVASASSVWEPFVDEAVFQE
jgi:hypothetical protein